MREDTKQKLYDLNLAELVSAIEEQEKNPQYAEMTFTERLDLAVDAVYQSKYNSQVKRLLSQAKLRFPDADAVNIAKKETMAAAAAKITMDIITEEVEICAA